MLDHQARSLGVAVPAEPATTAAHEIGLPQLLAFLRRQRWPISLTAAAFVALGIAYLAITPPSYTAQAVVLIDPTKVAIFSSGNLLEDASISNSGVETQVQVLESGRIGKAVVDKLNLTKDTAFMNPPASPLALPMSFVGRAISALVSLISPPPAKSAGPPPDPTDNAVGILTSHLNATRVGLSYVIDVAYISNDPQRAAQIANAVTAAYLDDQMRTQVNAAQSASEWLQGRLADLQNKAADETLSAQEKSAVRATYDSFLERYTQTVQQQSMPFVAAQVLTPAVAPTSKTSPKTLLIIAASLIVGAGMGFGVGLGRDLLDRTIRTREQVEAATGAPLIGFLPTFGMSRRLMRRIAARSAKLLDGNARRFAAGSADAIVLSAPLSRYAETIRAIKVAADNAPGGPVIVLGVVSALPNEGRSTVAVNLARMLAHGGARALLIDGDLRNPSLSRDLTASKAPGLAQLVSGAARISDVLWTDQATSLQFLPAGTQHGSGQATDALRAPETKAVIGACRQMYDFIIVDLPATIPVVDVRAAGHLFDGLLFVTEWGYATEDILMRGVRATGYEDKILGVVFNKVKLKSLRRFETAPQFAAPSGNYLKSYRHIA